MSDNNDMAGAHKG